MQLKRGMYNVLSGVLGQIVTIALGLVIPRLFIVNLGSEVNGLLSSISQIFVYFGLLEAGVGLATTQALYKPIANDDREGINSILAATDAYYKRTGIIYLTCVVGLSFIYPLVIETNIDRMTVFLIVILQGLGGVLSYFFQGKYRLLLTAEGKGYILTNLTTVIHVFVSVAKIALLLLGFNVIAIQGMYFVFNLVQMLFITIYIRREYKWIELKVVPNYEAISQKNFVLIHQISGMVFNNTDVLILTLFCGLKVVSIYSLYNLIFNMINTLMNTVSGSITFQLGQTYAVNKTKFIKIYDIYETYYTTLNFIVCTTAYVFILPFIHLYTSGVTDINYINTVLPSLFVLINLLSNGKLPSNQVINIAGHFKQTKWKGVIESIINLIISILCVNQFGMPGVLIGTVVALLYRANDMIIYANIIILKRTPLKTYIRWGVNICIFAITTQIANVIPWNNANYCALLYNATIFFICVSIVYIVVNTMIEFENFKFLIKYFMGSLKYKNVIRYRR